MNLWRRLLRTFTKRPLKPKTSPSSLSGQPPGWELKRSPSRVLKDPSADFWDVVRAAHIVGTDPGVHADLAMQRGKLLDKWPWPSDFMGGGGGPNAGETLMIDITAMIGSAGDSRAAAFLLKRKKQAEEYLAIENLDDWDRKNTKTLVVAIDRALEKCR